MRPFAFALVLVVSAAAHAQSAEEGDWSEAELARAEAALTDDPASFAADIDPSLVVCPEGARNEDGRCVDDGSLDASALAAGFVAGKGGPSGLFALGVIPAVFLLIRSRRRVALLPLLAVACGADATFGWDAPLDPVDASRELLTIEMATSISGFGSHHRLAYQPFDVTKYEAPSPQFSLAKAPFAGALPLRRQDTARGERLVVSLAAHDGELLGYAAPEFREGTAALYQLTSEKGELAYEAEPEALDALENEGFSRGAVIGFVWAPNAGAQDETALASDEEALHGPGNVSGPAPCRLRSRHALALFYAGFGSVQEDEKLLAGCPGEVVIAEHHLSPRASWHAPALRAAGARSAYVMADFGLEIRNMLQQPNGVNVTANFIRQRLAAGFDYVVVDEITAASDWADGSLVNRRFRQVLLTVPANKIIAYISLDLTEEAGGAAALVARKQLLRTLKLRGRAMALELYVHTGDAINGNAATIFRNANQRVLTAVHGMPNIAGISYKMITTIGLTMKSAYPQYEYLDWPARDLAGIDKQIHDIRSGGHSLAAERGVGFYFGSMRELQFPAKGPYQLDDLVAHVHAGMLRFR